MLVQPSFRTLDVVTAEVGQAVAEALQLPPERRLLAVYVCGADLALKTHMFRARRPGDRFCAVAVGRPQYTTALRDAIAAERSAAAAVPATSDRHGSGDSDGAAPDRASDGAAWARALAFVLAEAGDEVAGVDAAASSTRVRELIAAGRDIDALTGPAVRTALCELGYFVPAGSTAASGSGE